MKFKKIKDEDGKEIMNTVIYANHYIIFIKNSNEFEKPIVGTFDK